MRNISVKIGFGEEFRRFTLKDFGEDSGDNFERLTELVEECFDKRLTDFQLIWKGNIFSHLVQFLFQRFSDSDGDTILLSSERELMEAGKHLLRNEEDTLRLFINGKEELLPDF